MRLQRGNGMIGSDEYTTDTPLGSTITVHRNRTARADFVRDAQSAGFTIDGFTIAGGTPQEIRNAVNKLRSDRRRRVRR
jgi:hypothetical protein